MLSVKTLNMVTVIVETKNSEEALARTLAPLVSGAVAGLLREVFVFDTGSSDNTWKVAEQAGCNFVANASLMECILRARGDWLLLLEPGSRLGTNWVEAVERHIKMVQSPARFMRSRLGQPSFWKRIVKRESPLADGLLITKRQATALASDGRNSVALARGIAARRLNAEIELAGR
jgi:glycosyltransferase involved in cell wall biosynthesis